MTAQTQTAMIARKYAEQVVAGEILADKICVFIERLPPVKGFRMVLDQSLSGRLRNSASDLQSWVPP